MCKLKSGWIFLESLKISKGPFTIVKSDDFDFWSILVHILTYHENCWIGCLVKCTIPCKILEKNNEEDFDWRRNMFSWVVYSVLATWKKTIEEPKHLFKVTVGQNSLFSTIHGVFNFSIWGIRHNRWIRANFSIINLLKIQTSPKKLKSSARSIIVRSFHIKCQCAHVTQLIIATLIIYKYVSKIRNFVFVESWLFLSQAAHSVEVGILSVASS